jgi:hypothetical protein
MPFPSSALIFGIYPESYSETYSFEPYPPVSVGKVESYYSSADEF